MAIPYKNSVLILLLFMMCSVNGISQEISPYLFGQNLWLSNEVEGRTGFIDELWPKVKDSGVKLVRIGGGRYDRIMPSLDTLQHWVKGIKNIGAEPMLQVSKFDSPEESAALVRVFNIENENRIEYWAIGNESYHMSKFSVDSIANYIKAHASAMKAVDPTIKIFIPDLAAYYGHVYDELLRSDKNGIAGRDQNGNWYADGITFHNYPNAKEYTRSDVIFYSVSKMRGMVLDLMEDLEFANKKYGREGKDKLLWGITEFNITYHNPDDLGVEGIAVPSFINGQFWVDIFCMGMEYGAFTVAPWCIQESDRVRTYFGYVGGPPDFIPHSAFYHEQMMANYMEGEFVKMSSDNPFLKAFGSQSEDGTTIIFMNQHSETSFNVDLNKNNYNNKNTNYVNILSSKSFKGFFNGIFKSNSTSVLVFDKNGNLKKHIEYDMKRAIKNLPPENILK